MARSRLTDGRCARRPGDRAISELSRSLGVDAWISLSLSAPSRGDREARVASEVNDRIRVFRAGELAHPTAQNRGDGVRNARGCPMIAISSAYLLPRYLGGTSRDEP